MSGSTRERFDPACRQWIDKSGWNGLDHGTPLTVVSDDGYTCERENDKSDWPSGWTVRCLQPHNSADGKTAVIRLRMTKKDLYGTIGMCTPHARPTFWLGAEKLSVGLHCACDDREVPVYKFGVVTSPIRKSFEVGQELRLELTPERTLKYIVDGVELLRQTLIPDGWVFAVGGCGKTAFEILDDDLDPPVAIAA